ncbi:GOLPH3/VPS74 family protein [Nocardioides piscis]|uniref:GPP34 family phosphoprotein n=1 Tax=Nocardioides piscis TaxID=2714938 RepID=A0A6G7YK45_9ACTN|nr:GPP34 family phosphoprotein [Nocardioides piscis]QIK77114.1 GPP34 family phosphoprotein [Nocardioides piscis]
MSTLIAEDLLLLLLDDETGRLAHSDKIRPLLGGALLIELALAGRVEVEDKTSMWSTAKVVVPETPPPDDPAAQDPVLGAALELVRDRPRAARDLVDRLGKGSKETLLDRLADRGLVRPVTGKVLGLFPRTTWPAIDREHEAAVRRRLQDVLVQGLVPDERTAAIVALLSTVDHAHKVVDRGDLSTRQVKKRAKEIAAGAWAAQAVRDAVKAAQAATTAAVVAGATVAAAAGG